MAAAAVFGAEGLAAPQAAAEVRQTQEGALFRQIESARPGEGGVTLPAFATLCRDYLEIYPFSEHSPEVRDLLGVALWEGGEREAAVEVFRWLTRVSPDSPRAGDAYAAIGEYYFDPDGGAYDVDRAGAAYSRAASLEGASARAWALYRSAWIHRLLGEDDLFVERMKEAVAELLDRETRGESEPWQRELREQAMVDLVDFYEQREDARCEGADCGGPLGRERLGALSAWHCEEGRAGECARVCAQLSALEPSNPENVDCYERVVWSWFLQGEPERTDEALAALRAGFGPGSAWAAAQRPEVAAGAEARAADLARLVERYMDTVRGVAPPDTGLENLYPPQEDTGLF